MAKKPNIRFAGFEDDWEQRKLGEVCSEIGDGLHSAPKYNDNGEVFFINGNNLVDGHIVIDPLKTRRVSKETFEKNNKHLDNNTLLLSINGTIGNLAYYQGEQVMLGKSIAYLKVNGIDHFFLYTSLQTAEILNSFMISLTGTTIKNLGLEAIKNTIIAVPKLEEQHKIGVYFSALDHLITLHQRKCDELKKVKKFMLQKMFPKKGEKNPEIRFDGFTNDWEQRKFSELYAKSSEKNDGSIGMDRNITVATMQFKEDVKVSTAEYLKTYYTFNLGDIAFEGHQSKEFRYGRFVENDIGNGIVSHIFAVFRPIKEFDLQFWKYAINNEMLMQRILSRSTKASTMMHDLVTEDFLNEIFLVPSLNEQKKIGTYLKSIDHLITLHQRKCEELKNVKKYMLQNMFAKGE